MELPVGLSMALAQNEKAMLRFAAMQDADKAAMIEKARRAQTRNDMQQLVDGLNEGGAV